MKIRKLFKKAAAFALAADTALSVIPATTAFAAGDIGTISFNFAYDSNGNAIRYNSSDTFNGYTAGGTGHYHYRMFIDGETGFCIQPGVPLKTGNTLKKASSDTWNALSANQKKAVGLALLYGYQGNKSNLTGSDDEKWLATQTLVWEFVTGCREATGSYKKVSNKIYDVNFGSNYPNSGAKAAYDQIVSMLTAHNTIPSFMSGGKKDITKELAYKDGKYSITLTDSNGVLSDYTFTSSDSSVTVSKSGNKLTITSEKAVSGSVRITATRNNVPTVSSSAKLMVCYCSYDNPLGVPWPTEAVGTDSYLEAMQVFLDRVQAQVELVRGEQEKYKFDMTPFTIEDCIPDARNQSIVGKVVVINAEPQRYEYQHSAYQLVLAESGNGATGGRGQAVFGTCLATGERARWERYDVLGEIRPERMPDWAKTALEKIKAQEKEKKQRNREGR